MSELSIIPFKEEHIKDALEIYNYYIANSTATFSVEPITEEGLRKLAFTGLERFPSFALLEEDKLVGYSLLNRYKPREAYDTTAETTIYLDKDTRGNGYGSKALAHLEEIAKGYNFRALLGVICAENTESIKLFKKHDYFECAHFREVGVKFGRVLDVVIYEKLI